MEILEGDYKPKAPLEMIGKDHKVIYSSGSSIADVMGNSGKTAAELLSDQEIAKYLLNQREALINLKRMAIERSSIKDTYESFLEGQRMDFAYLKRIGRYENVREIMKAIVNSPKS